MVRKHQKMKLNKAFNRSLKGFCVVTNILTYQNKPVGAPKKIIPNPFVVNRAKNDTPK